MKRIFFLCVILSCLTGISWSQTPSENAAVQVHATVSSSPASITVKWASNPGASSMVIYRKLAGAANWGSIYASLGGSATQYVDNSVSIGQLYEYKLVRSGSNGNGYGYLASGIEVPAIEQRGKMILMIDNTHLPALEQEIQVLIKDLRGDGWGIIRHDVSPSASVPSIKSLIVSDYNSDPSGVKAVFLLGHIPVPYTGNVIPDGHTENQGAWPADVYYGDIDGVWTDNYFHTTSSNRPENHNVAGDGKFDQNDIPSEVELQVGRVDMYNMPAFSQSETQMLADYLDKAHDYKQSVIDPQIRGIVFDNLQWISNPLSSSGWRNIAQFVGPSNITAPYPYGVPHSSYVNNQSYLWTFASGGGIYYVDNGEFTFIGSDNVGTTSQYANMNMGGIFNMSFGSYFGDWDNKNNFLRALIASGNSLTNCWSAIPNYYFHHMAMGQNIGFSIKATQNNTSTYTPLNSGWQSTIGRTHVAMMGDPSLRVHMIDPPSNFIVGDGGGFPTFSWTASPEAGVIGYYIYEVDTIAETISRITPNIVTGTAYQDLNISISPVKYMVRAVKLTTSHSGSYYDMSTGVISGPIGGQPQIDCNGILNGPDMPGTPCDDGDPNTSNDQWDINCYCVGQSVDCAGVPNGSAVIDNCGICAGGTTGITPNADMDCMGVCFGSSVADCNGDCNGSATLDNCGVCAGGNSGNTPGADEDCNGDCFGTAVIDNCGVCAGGNTGNIPNADEDCLGVCFGTAVVDNCGICNGNNNCNGTTICNYMAFGSDNDAEEAFNGNIYFDEGPFDMVYDSSPDHWRGDQTSGMRFDGIEVPNGALILDAYIQFTTQTTENIDPCQLSISAELDPNASLISWNPFNISSRPRTTSNVPWAPPNWNIIDEAGPAQRTPDLKDLIQEVVDQVNWTPNNAMVFIIEGTGGRSAWSFNTDPVKSAQLCISYTEDTLITDCLGIPGGTAVYDDCGVCDGDNSSCDECNRMLEVDGSAEVALYDELKLGGDLTMEFWIRLDPGIDDKDQPFGNGIDQVLNFENGSPSLNVPMNVLEGSTPLMANTWTHYAITRQNGDLKLFVNGVEDIWAYSSPYNGDIFISEISTNIGPGWMSGSMDELRFWNYARSPTEILNNLFISVNYTAPDLLAYFKFNENGGPVIDNSGSGFNGTFPNSGADRPVSEVAMEDSCGQSGVDEPVAGFFANEEIICVGQPVDFFDTSTNSPHAWAWSFEAADSLHASEQDPTGVVWSQPGLYSVSLSATNAYGTDFVETMAYITVLPAPTVNGSVTDVACFGEANGSVVSNVSGGQPGYTYSWDNASNDEDISNLYAGVYTLTVSDQNGCIGQQSFTVLEPDELDLSAITSTAETCDFNDGTATINPSGGSAPYTFLWDDPLQQVSATATGLVAGTYSVLVTDLNNCESINSIDVAAPVGCGGTTALIPIECGSTNVGLTDTLHAIEVVGAQNYQFNFAIPGIYSRNIATGSASTLLPLNWIQTDPLVNAQTYNVQIRPMVNGVWEPWADTCQITTETIIVNDTTQLVAQECGIQDVHLNDTLHCDSVVGAQDYQFRFENVPDAYIRNISIGSNSTALALNWIQTNPLLNGKSYDVTVRAKLNNSWGPLGPTCQITTHLLDPNPYTTQLTNYWCNAFDVELSEEVAADPILGSQNYQYRFEIPGSYIRQIKTNSPNSLLYLGWYTNPLIPGETYDVQVRVKVGGTWGVYGPVCGLTISSQGPQVANSRSIGADQVDILIFPNPSQDGVVSIFVENIPEGISEMHVEMYDMNGKVILSRQFDLPDISTLLFRNDQALSSGLYMLRVVLGDEIHSKRVIVH